MIEFFGYILIGTGVALMSSFLGFGGGTLIVPFLPIVSGLGIKETIATSLAVVALNSANNSYNFHKKKLINWKLVLSISVSSILFAIISSKLTHIFDEMLVRWIVITIFTTVVFITILGPARMPSFMRKNNLFNHIVSGILAGVASGFGGIGGATVLIPLFIIGKWTENQEVAPTGNAINMLTAFASVITLAFSNEKVEWQAVILILIFSITISFFARKKQHLLSEKLRRYLIIIYLSIVIILQVARAIKLT